MGRRSVATASDLARLERDGPRAARDAVVTHFRRLTGAAGVNLAQFKAQVHEEEMIDLLVGFTRDVTLPATLRRQCALDVVLVARGPIRPWEHAGETIDPSAEGRTGATVGTEIEATRLTADAYMRIASLTMRQVPFSQWPEDLQAAADPALATFTEDDASASG